jgi:hypothetical protein
MSKQSISKKRSGTLGDAAVDGLFGGMVAGLVMAMYLFVVVALAGNSPVDFFAGLAPGDLLSPVSGGLLHVAVSGVYGAVFGALTSRISFLRSDPQIMVSGASGIVYGLGLLIAARLIVLPTTNSSLAHFPIGHLATSHLLYGLVLGFMTVERQDP